MSEPDDGAPEVRRKRGISIVWLVPLLALALGGWLVWTTIQSRGPVVTIMFPTAEGLEAGRTEVKLRDVVVGTVSEINLADDIATVVTTVEMVPAAEAWLTSGTRFWIVQPQIGIEGVTGLSTLLSGPYIAVDPGEGEPARRFEGLQRRPPVPRDAAGTRFLLASEQLGALRVGSPVFFRELAAGEITGFRVPKRPELTDGDLACEVTPGRVPRSFAIEVFVRAPYDELVHADSRFVNTSGIAFDISGQRVSIELQSIGALLSGGVAFGTVEDLDDTSMRAESCEVFALYADPEEARSTTTATHATPYLLFFEDSIGGLEEGAAVTFRGIEVGRVTEIDLRIDLDADALRIPVEIEVFDGVFDLRGGPAEQLDEIAFADWAVQRGLRAQLAVSNLLTGALEIRLGLHPDAPPASLGEAEGVPVIPTLPSSLGQLRGSVEAILAKLAALPLAELSGQLSAVLADAERIVGSPAIPAAIEDAGATAAALRALAESLDAAADPLVQDARSTLQSARGAMASTADVAGDANRVAFEAQQLMTELRAAARAIRTFAEYLERNPEALIQGRRGRR